jgi:orotate phosphoribosyltransferase
MGAVTVAHELARQTDKLSGFTEKRESGGMINKRFDVKGSSILLVEDVVTTGNTTRKTVQALQASGATILPYVLAIVNRSGEDEIDGRKIISSVILNLDTFYPADCPYCKAGSKVLRPKENWAELTGHTA